MQTCIYHTGVDCGYCERSVTPLQSLIMGSLQSEFAGC